MKIVSVIIPCYNAAETIGRTLTSCQIQSNVAEILVVDDGSTDTSCEIVEAFSKSDERIRLIKLPSNNGPAYARNWGVLQSNADLIAFLDADDEYLGDALNFPTQALIEHNELAAVRLGVEFFGFPEDICQHASFKQTGHVLCNTFAGNLLVRKEVFLAMGAFPLTPIFRAEGGEDGAVSLALSNHALVGTFYDIVGVRVHYHPKAHAEKFFRISMTGGAGVDTLQGDKKAVWDASMQYSELAGLRLKRLQAILSSTRKGFAPLHKKI